MVATTRRRFIGGMSACTIPGMLTISSGLAVADAKEVPDRKVLLEMIQVRDRWKEAEVLSPIEFLKMKGVDVKQKQSIVMQSQKDFRDGEILDVNGLILAKTEAATLAYSAECIIANILQA